MEIGIFGMIVCGLAVFATAMAALKEDKKLNRLIGKNKEE